MVLEIWSLWRFWFASSSLLSLVKISLVRFKTRLLIYISKISGIIILPERFQAGSVGIQCFVGLLQELIARSFPLGVQYLIKSVTIIKWQQCLWTAAWQGRARHVYTVTNLSWWWWTKKWWRAKKIQQLANHM
jgi:hypothetical protein